MSPCAAPPSRPPRAIITIDRNKLTLARFHHYHPRRRPPLSLSLSLSLCASTAGFSPIAETGPNPEGGGSWRKGCHHSSPLSIFRYTAGTHHRCLSHPGLGLLDSRGGIARETGEYFATFVKRLSSLLVDVFRQIRDVVFRKRGTTEVLELNMRKLRPIFNLGGKLIYRCNYNDT